MTSLALNLELWPRQMEAFESEATELLFGGATEGGKSHFVRVALIAWCLAIPGLQCVLIRKKYSDILNNHVEGRTGFKALLAQLIASGHVTVTQTEIRFPKGSIIRFQHCQDERQFDSAQGVEVHVLTIDEATQISERLIRFFRTWVRMPKEMRDTLPKEHQGRFPKIIYTANPIGASVSYFRRTFVKARPMGKVEKVEGFLRQYILSRYTDNLSVDAEAHQGRLAGIGDAALARALDEGDWDAPTGEFFPEWDEKRHVVLDFVPPSHWYRYRSMDIGWNEPTAVYWIAVSDGEPFRDAEGRERWFPRGARVFYQEWYLCDLEHPAKGVGMRNEDIAKGILERTEIHARHSPTLTDSKPFQGMGGEHPALTFQKEGVILTKVDTGPGTRVTGWSVMRSALVGAGYDTPEGGVKLPMVYFCQNCTYARDYIPALPRHPSEAKKEDAAEHGETTHSCDAIRYGLVGHPIIKDHVAPIESRIKKEIEACRPTVKRITNQQGARIF